MSDIYDEMRQDRDLWRGMYLSAMKRHLNLGTEVLKLAARGDWAEVVECAAEHLDGCVGWQERDTEIYLQAQASAQATRAAMHGQLALDIEESHGS